MVEHVTMVGDTHTTVIEYKTEPMTQAIVDHWFWTWIEEYPDEY